jgi:hypothetical protein
MVGTEKHLFLQLLIDATKKRVKKISQMNKLGELKAAKT